MIRRPRSNSLLLVKNSHPKTTRRPDEARRDSTDAGNASDSSYSPDSYFRDWPTDSEEESLVPFAAKHPKPKRVPAPKQQKERPKSLVNNDESTFPLPISSDAQEDPTDSRQQVSHDLVFGLLHDDMVLPSGRNEACWYDPFNPTHLPTSNQYSIVRRRSPDPKTSRPKRTWSSQELINDTRLALDLPPYENSRLLDDLAQLHAEKMAQQGHLSYSVHSLLQLSIKVGSVQAGENILRGPSVYKMHKAMIHGSSPHWGNLLAREFQRVGVGTCPDQEGKLYMCQLFAGPVVSSSSSEQQQQPATTTTSSKKRSKKKKRKKRIFFKTRT